jgi:adenosylmethionine-8-amino-7-oxononanoate aminotransferase
VVSFALGYQGATLLSRSLSDLPRSQHILTDPATVTTVNLPVEPAELRRPESLPLLLAAFEDAIDSDPSEPPMAVVVEPFLNVGGGVVLPPGFLSGIRKLCDASGALMIVDEVFTAYGRCGAMFACAAEDVVPDILVSSKGLSGGYVPIAAVTAQPRVYDTFGADRVIGGLRYGHTTSGHAVACAAALATLDVIEQQGLLERSRRLGRAMLRRLNSLAALEQVVDVRGLGLILVVELASDEVAAQAVQHARAQGLLLRRQGKALMAVPALTITDDAAETLLDRMESALIRTLQ